jgi:hypothetical protein
MAMGNCSKISKLSTHASLNMTSPITFTRYLYLKDEVQLSLLVALLNKKDNVALHWAYELYYSGFEEEVFQHLWKIYYDFYYTLNPSFQDYFVKKYKEWGKATTQDRERIVALIVGDLLIRPHNLDVFMLRQAVKYTKEEFSEVESFEELLENRDYLRIANRIMESSNSLQIVKESIAYFSKKGLKIEEDKMVKRWKKYAKYLGMDESVQILAFIMCHFSQLDCIQMGKKLYICVEKEDIVVYETIFKNKATNYRAYKILPIAYICAIDEDNYLSLFQLERNKILMDDPDGLRKIYWYNWEYYASFSPVWFDRIQKCKGKHNHETKRIEFPEDEETDWPEEFYSHFGYEPDEQKREIQEKSIQKIEKQRTWEHFFIEHGKNGLFKPDCSLFTEMKFVVY